MRTAPSRPLVHAIALLVAALAALPGCTDRGPLAPPTLEPLEVSVGAKWLRDRKGRVVILRGATYTITETGVDIGPFRGPGEKTLAHLEALGMNLVRLPLAWSRLEPRPGQRTSHDLKMRVDPVIRMAAAHGLAVVLSLHPWPRGACLDDPTMPDWVCDALASGDEAPPHDPGCAFWREDTALRRRYAQVWAVIARHYAQDARVVGFDVLDEPWAGDCVHPSMRAGEQLSSFYHFLHLRIRKAGASQALLYEPALPREDGPRLERFGSPVVFSPHLWSQRLGPPADAGADPLPEAYARAARDADDLGGPLLVGEYGGDLPPTSRNRGGGTLRPTSAAFAYLSLDQLDRHLAGGAFYALRPDSAASPSVAADIRDVEAVLARPYARRIAGIPTEMSFAPRTLEFRLRFDDDPRYAPPDPTEIFLPVTALYADGFQVEIEPDGAWRFDEHTGRLLIYRGSGTSHEVRVRPN